MKCGEAGDKTEMTEEKEKDLPNRSTIIPYQALLPADDPRSIAWWERFASGSVTLDEEALKFIFDTPNEKKS